MAAQRLQQENIRVVVLEAQPHVGGRMATRELSLADGTTARFDHGAQYFTARSPRFGRRVERWLQDDIVEQWSNGFATPEQPALRDGHARFRGQPDMSAIPRHLAANVDVRLKTRIRAVRYADGWSLVGNDGVVHRARALILTPPVPQTLALLDAGNVSLNREVVEILAAIEYDPCWALLAVLDGPSRIPAPGGLWPGGGTIAWMADNEQKGISPVPCVTIHASREFSRAQATGNRAEVANLLLEEARPWLGARVLAYELKYWPYSIPVRGHREPTLCCSQPGLVAFAGDAFAGPRVEGAALSGLAAADAILQEA